jgi:hypothetical protein
VVGDTLVEPDETVILTLGTPKNATLGNNKSYTHTITNDDTLFVQFASTSGSAPEGNGGFSIVKVQATLSAAATQTVTVPITYAGTATLGEDYTDPSTSLTIAVGQTKGTATFKVLGDTKGEQNETVVLTLGTPTNATLGANKSYTHTITNDDGILVQFKAMSGSANEGNSGNTTVSVEAILSAAATQTVTVPITYAGTATSGKDYINASSSLTFAAGQTTTNATFSVVGDTALEANETVILTLGTPTNATLGANKSYTHAIINDDASRVETVRGSGSNDAAGANVRYNFIAGTYAYTISGFGRGDVLNFPGVDPVVDNSLSSDGQVTLRGILRGPQTITVTLIGLSSTEDALLQTAADFNTLFGAGTLIS